MTIRPIVFIAAAVVAGATTSVASAQTLDLALTPRVVSFPSSDPDAVPIVAAAPVTINYRIRQNSGAPWSLTLLAGGDLISGADQVDISNVTWTATPAPPFQSGTVSKTVAQRIASGSGNVANLSSGSVTFRLANSWTYSTGTYTQTIIFTLSAP
jgi:hypothetical protein